MARDWEFNVEQVVERLRQEFHGRMLALNLPTGDVDKMIDLLTRMTEVAAKLIIQDKEIKVPGTAQSIPFDNATAEQTMRLFCEGLYHALLKSWELRLPEDLKERFLQQVALYVYDSAKQMVFSTYGQEDTPDRSYARTS